MCACAEKVNAALAGKNAVLVSNMLAETTRATIALCKRAPKLRGSLPILEASHCPFCGDKYPQSAGDPILQPNGAEAR